MSQHLLCLSVVPLDVGSFLVLFVSPRDSRVSSPLQSQPVTPYVSSTDSFPFRPFCVFNPVLDVCGSYTDKSK